MTEMIKVTKQDTKTIGKVNKEEIQLDALKKVETIIEDGCSKSKNSCPVAVIHKNFDITFRDAMKIWPCEECDKEFGHLIPYKGCCPCIAARRNGPLTHGIIMEKLRLKIEKLEENKE